MDTKQLDKLLKHLAQKKLLIKALSTFWHFLVHKQEQMCHFISSSKIGLCIKYHVYESCNKEVSQRL